MTTRYKVVVEHDDYPDYSWLDQKEYDPTQPGYEPITVDGQIVDGEWYRNRSNHVALLLTVFVMTDEDDDWRHLDNIGGIDFLITGMDWQTGTFYRYDDMAKFPYLQELALDIIGPDWRPSACMTCGQVVCSPGCEGASIEQEIPQ